MKNKLLALEQKVGAKLICRKAKAVEKIKDKGSAEPIIIVAILCVAVALLIFGKPLLENVFKTLANKAQTGVSDNF